MFRATRTARIIAVAATALLAAGSTAWVPDSLALDGPLGSMEVLVGGAPLPEHFSGGTWYLEAREGTEYAVRLTNRTGGRVAVALSVDGLNSIDAKTSTSLEASKWILGPYESVTISGWQTSSSTARRFFFTTEERSYGAWLGKTLNLGIISAAFFRERWPQPPPISRFEKGGERDGSRADEALPQAAPESRAKPRERGGGGRSADSPEASHFREAAPSDLAATGIGREMGHRVRRIHFATEDAPAQVLHLRYEYRDALVRLGVLPRYLEDDSLERRERARGFLDPGYAPDPYRAHRP